MLSKNIIIIFFTLIVILITILTLFSFKNKNPLLKKYKLDFIAKMNNKYNRGILIPINNKNKYEIRMYTDKDNYFVGTINKNKMKKIFSKGKKDNNVISLTLSNNEIANKTGLSINKIKKLRKMNIRMESG